MILSLLFLLSEFESDLVSHHSSCTYQILKDFVDSHLSSAKFMVKDDSIDSLSSDSVYKRQKKKETLR